MPNRLHDLGGSETGGAATTDRSAESRLEKSVYRLETEDVAGGKGWSILIVYSVYGLPLSGVFVCAFGIEILRGAMLSDWTVVGAHAELVMLI